MGTLDIDNIAPDTSQKVMLGLTIFAWILAFVYESPEQTREVLTSVGFYNIAPAYDMPTIIPILLFLWMFIGILDAIYIHLKVMSDVAMAEGMDGCESCVGSKLHESGDWGWLRVGGTKAFPIEGGSVWIGLKTHIHRIGNHIVFESQMTPKTPLDYVPFELKPEIRQRRTGLFGVDNCSVGYLSAKELATHKEFKTDEFKKHLTTEDKGKVIPDVLNTSEFIGEIRVLNKTVDMGEQLINNESKSLTESLKTIKDVGSAITPTKSKGILQHIFG